MRLVAALVAMVSGGLLALFVFTPWIAYPDTDRDYEMRISGGGANSTVGVGESTHLRGIRIFTQYQYYDSHEIGPRLARRFRWSVLPANDTTWKRHDVRDVKQGRASIDAAGRLTGLCEGGVMVEMREGKGRAATLFTVVPGTHAASASDCE